VLNLCIYFASFDRGEFKEQAPADYEVIFKLKEIVYKGEALEPFAGKAELSGPHSPSSQSAALPPPKLKGNGKMVSSPVLGFGVSLHRFKVPFHPFGGIN
jgi:hypothetical protein